MKMREIIGTIGIVKFLILMVASTFWVMVQHIPYVPLGLLVIVYFLGKQELKVYLPFVVMSIIGFIGTGLYFNTYTTTRTMLKTGKTFTSQHFRIAYRLGTSTLDYLLKDDSIIICDDGKHEEEVTVAKAYVKKFEKAFFEKDSTFMVESFVYQRGVTKEYIKRNFEEMQKGKWLSKSSYMGYLYWVYPKHMNHREISLFYKVQFEKDGQAYGTVMYRLVLDNNETKLTQFGALKANRKFKILK